MSQTSQMQTSRPAVVMNIVIRPDIRKQTIVGIGSSFTESSAFVLAQFSRTIRPGDRALQASKHLEGIEDDALHASATINSANLVSVQLLNTTKHPIRYSLQIGGQFAPLTIAANAVQTVRVQL